ncbi:MAG: hypothetical protein ACD_24C00460G0001 [uncultured bacterium]|nr:MAG: hypothetical protein ACD_24C00460G0001 [uncultured bacterium]
MSAIIFAIVVSNHAFNSKNSTGNINAPKSRQVKEISISARKFMPNSGFSLKKTVFEKLNPIINRTNPTSNLIWSLISELLYLCLGGGNKRRCFCVAPFPFFVWFLTSVFSFNNFFPSLQLYVCYRN